jgi:hypothetical protein
MDKSNSTPKRPRRDKDKHVLIPRIGWEGMTQWACLCGLYFGGPVRIDDEALVKIVNSRDPKL